MRAYGVIGEADVCRETRSINTPRLVQIQSLPTLVQWDDTNSLSLCERTQLSPAESAPNSHLFAFKVYILMLQRPCLPWPDSVCCEEIDEKECVSIKVLENGVMLKEVKAYSRIGIPSEEITRLAAEESIDLIVMGTHGRAGFGHMFHRRVAETVLRTAGCSVLIIKSSAHETPSDSE